jgi:hypothetical protein
MNDDFDDWDGEPHDLDGYGDVTGDPQLDVYGYNSPTRRGQNLSGFTSHDAEVVARWDARREQRAAARQRAARRDEMRRRNALPPEPNKGEGRGVVAPAPAPRPSAGPLRPAAGPLPGQHGAYFERRVVRRWWAPWTKRTTWQQISAWHHGQPPAGTEVVTVADVAQLPGRVHTIGGVSGMGAVEY